MNTDLTQLGIGALRTAYAGGRISPLAVTQAYLEAIARQDARLRAFIHVCSDHALVQAQASTLRWSRGQPLGPLDGVVMTLKDNIDVAQMPCTAGTAAYAHRIPSHNAPAYQRLADAGVVLLGKLNMHEAALGATTDNPVYGRCINPLRDGYTPGGSSGGSAAAVAAHLCVSALGTDTLGSVRIPAAYCGLFGFIPSRGAVPLQGIVPLSPTLDAVGPLARTGHDLAEVAAVLLQISCPVPVEASVWQGLRIGLLPQCAQVELQSAVQAGFDALCARLRKAGAVLYPVALPAWDPASSRRHGLLMSEWESADYWQAAVGPDWPGLSSALVKMLRYGQSLDPAKRRQAQTDIEGLRSAAASLFAQADVVLLPTTPQVSFPHAQSAPVTQADLTALANILGVPALAFPCPGDDFPVSCQLLAARGDDARLLMLAQALDTLYI